MMAETILNDAVVTKYLMAAEITNTTLKDVMDKCMPGASVRELCIMGDKTILDKAGKRFKNDTKMSKGIAFPTCISVNECICHFSPLRSESDYILKDGDVCKIDMGSHIDGFMAVLTHTMVVTQKGTITGPKADVCLAAYYASEAALRLLKPGKHSSEITEVVQKIAESYNCKPVAGVLSYTIEKNKITADKTIKLNPNQVPSHQLFGDSYFGNLEVYAIDIIITTGDGNAKFEDRVSIFRKALHQEPLKLKASRAFYNEIQRKYGIMAFTLRDFVDENKARLGSIECLKSNMIAPYPVVYAEKGDIVAAFKFTVLLLPNGSKRITGLPFDSTLFESEYQIDDEDIKKLLASPVNPGLKTRKKPGKKLLTAVAVENAEEIPNSPSGE